MTPIPGTEYSFVNLGDRYAVMERSPGGCWNALYFVLSLQEAVEFADLCRRETAKTLGYFRERRRNVSPR